jgi:hypothetical protein
MKKFEAAKKSIQVVDFAYPHSTYQQKAGKGIGKDLETRPYN